MFILNNSYALNKGQPRDNEQRLYFWRSVSLRGEFKTKGFYRRQDILRNDFADVQKRAFASGGLSLKSKSFFIHPDFLTMNVTAGYYPETNQSNYIVAPDRAEVRTLKELSLMGTSFEHKKITINSFVNLNEGYQNREYLNSLKSDNKQWGASLMYRNKLLPISVDFRKRKWQQKEIETSRIVTMEEKSYHARVSKSFASRDKHELSYSHNDFANMNAFANSGNVFHNKGSIDNINLRDNVYFDIKKKNLFNSTITALNQSGNINTKRIQAFENLTLSLPRNMTSTSNYTFFKTIEKLNNITQQSLRSSLEHKLFYSLNSRLSLEAGNTSHSDYSKIDLKGGIDFQYTKKIPKGRLALSYSFLRWHQAMNSDKTSKKTSNEEYTLNDNEIILLKSPNVIVEDVVVRDPTGTITYQAGFDYILIVTNSFLEIRRIPGGLIANNSIVFIDYTSTKLASYKFDMDNQLFGVNVMLFKNKIELYYRVAKQDNKNLVNTEFSGLNYYTRNSTGVRLDFGFLKLGAEYENYQSNIVPYLKQKYYVNFQKNYRVKWLFSLNSNLEYYQMILQNGNLSQQNFGITGKMAYLIFYQTKLNLDLTYRNQQWRDINFDMVTSKMEITTAIRQTYITFGAEVYKRNYRGRENVNFREVYIQLSRRF